MMYMGWFDGPAAGIENLPCTSQVIFLFGFYFVEWSNNSSSLAVSEKREERTLTN
jgi:hypothetical protein